MERVYSYVLAVFLVFVAVEPAIGQTNKWREIHKVKKKETIFGIARQYGLTIQDLINANPEMNQPGYELKKDTYVVIPYAKDSKAETDTSTVAAGKAETSVSGKVPAPVKTSQQLNRPIRMGVMLPLHDINGDGRRMVEYYRGLLMACDSLKKLGISVDVHAWNTPENEDIGPLLKDKAARQCDFIVGPLYSKQMAALSDFVTENDIKLVIPFSINAPQLMTNRNIYQIYQSANSFNDMVITQFLRQFKDFHPVFIDCNDSTSTKGTFTFGLRRKLEAQGTEYGITNLKSSEANFAKSFSKTLPNVVILNTGRSPELNVAFAKLNGLVTTTPGVRITMFGYTDWMMYTKFQLENFYKFDVYIPAAFHYNPLTSKTMRVEQKYRWNFHQDMMQSLPRFAIPASTMPCSSCRAFTVTEWTSPGHRAC